MSDNGSGTRIARAALLLCALLAVVVVVLGLRALRPVSLDELSESQRLLLLTRAEGIAPPVFQPFPQSGEALFYHLQARGRYEGAFNANFVANELGFRSPPLAARGERKRLLLVGDSWTFSPHVKDEETLTHAVGRALLEADPSEAWEVQNLSMIGWNLDNQLAALRAFITTLSPDLVVFCTTSNDIDDGFSVWKGHLVSRGFDSGAVFKASFEYERRWIDAFQRLDGAARFLAEQRIASFVFLLAEWRGLAPYYAERAGFETPYAVVPTPYIERAYRLAPEVDPSLHPSADGYTQIARSLVASLARANLLGAGAALATELEAVAPGHSYRAADVQAEFEAWWPRARTRPRGPFYDGHMGLEAFVSATPPRGTRALELRFELIDDAALYPLQVDAELLGGERRAAVFDRYAPGVQRIELPVSEHLRGFPGVEARVRADRVIARPPALVPMSITRPQLAAAGS